MGFVETRWLLAQFDLTHSKARGAYRRFVKEGINVSLWDELKSGIVLGSDEFGKKAQEPARDWESHPEITKKQQHPSQRPLSKILEGCESDRALRNQLLYEAVIHEGHTQTAAAKHIGLHPATVSRIVKQISENT